MNKEIKETSKNSDLNILLCAVLGLVLASYIASNSAMTALEKVVFDFIYDLPTLLTGLFYVITQTGTPFVALLIISAIFLINRRKLAVFVMVSTGASFILAYIVKILIARPRPSLFISDVTARYESVDSYGFVSGHTAITTAIALSIMPFVPSKYRWLLWAWICFVALSRIHLGVHAPLDVIGGFLVGLIVVKGLCFVINLTAKHGWFK